MVSRQARRGGDIHGVICQVLDFSGIDDVVECVFDGRSDGGHG